MRRVLCSLALVFVTASLASAGGWTLAARPFSFVQVRDGSAAERAVAEELPLLVLEQISENLVRLPPQSEMLDRELSSLREERLSLFLQLSAAVQERDSLVLSEKNGRALQKKIASAEKKIEDIRNRLADSLLEEERISLKYGEPESYEPRPETVSVMRTLFVPSGEAAVLGPESEAFSKAAAEAGINGLVCADLRVYGGYVSATATLYLFPGARAAGTVTEVGALDDIMRLSASLAKSIVPLVTNSAPVPLEFSVLPQECMDSVRVTLDGIMYGEGILSHTVSAGLHTVELSCGGYATKRFSYTFAGASSYRIEAVLVPSKEVRVDLSLSSMPGTALYVDGIRRAVSDDGTVHLVLDGSDSLGQLVAFGADGEPTGETAFLSIPSSVQSAVPPASAAVAVKARLADSLSLIDRRRIWTYRAYTALLVSLPLTFISMGNFDSAANAYLNGSLQSPDTAYAWNAVRCVSLGVTAVCGVFFIVELVRYLYAADSVIPARAHEVPSADAASGEDGQLHDEGGL